eukprot:gene26106-biopygen14083
MVGSPVRWLDHPPGGWITRPVGRSPQGGPGPARWAPRGRLHDDPPPPERSQNNGFDGLDGAGRRPVSRFRSRGGPESAREARGAS